MITETVQQTILAHERIIRELREVLTTFVEWPHYPHGMHTPEGAVMARTLDRAQALLDRTHRYSQDSNRCVADYDSVEEGLADINHRRSL